MELATLVPVYCPDTDNIHPIVVKLRQGQNLSTKKSQPFKTSLLETEETIKIIVTAPHPPVINNEVLLLYEHCSSLRNSMTHPIECVAM